MINLIDGHWCVERLDGLCLAWVKEHGLRGLRTHMVAWLGTTCFTVWCVNRKSWQISEAVLVYCWDIWSNKTQGYWGAATKLWGGILKSWCSRPFWATLLWSVLHVCLHRISSVGRGRRKGTSFGMAHAELFQENKEAQDCKTQSGVGRGGGYFQTNHVVNPTI